MSTAPDAAPRTSRPVYPSDLARSARRREKREAERAALRAAADPRQVALDLANALDEVARRPEFGAAPELVARVNGLALSIRIRGNSSPDRDADSVLDAMHRKLPARTLSEIASETGLVKAEAKKVLAAMCTVGVVREVRRPGASVEYWPTGQRCGDVLP